ncbi:MAG TPA: hypothetical protein VIK01_18820 [Polyangiaceae bacterium]
MAKISGFTLVDPASGLVCAFRRTSTKIYEALDRYSPREMFVHFGQYSLEEVAQIERAEVGRGPVGLKLASGGWPSSQTLQVVTSCLQPPLEAT